MLTKKICFIINPLAGGKSKKRVEALIKEAFEPLNCEYFLIYTEGPKHATALAHQAVKEGIDILAVVGGDGTIHEVGQALVGTKCALAIIPCGSGNGLARHLKIPLNPKKALKLIKNPHEILIDTIKINEHVYFNVAGIGFDAHVGNLFSKCSKRGFSNYLLQALKEYFSYKSQEYTLIVDGEILKRRALLISFANSSQWGNNAYIAPQANISDGLLDIAIVRDFPKYAAFNLLRQLFTKSLYNSEHLEFIKAKEVIIKTKNIQAHIDGEPSFFQDETTLIVNPSSLRVLVK